MFDRTHTHTSVNAGDARWLHLGLLGPLLRAVEGDRIVLHVLNRLEFGVTMHAHGVFYYKPHEGAPYADGLSHNVGSGVIAAGDEGVVEWLCHASGYRICCYAVVVVPKARCSFVRAPLTRARTHAPGTHSAPTERDHSSIIWIYHGHADEAAHVNAGLVGPIIWTRRELADEVTGEPLDVDRELVLLFTLFNENSSPLVEQTTKTTKSAAFD